MMDKENLVALGRIKVMEERKYAICTELGALSEGLHEKVPVIDGALHEVTEIDVKAAQVLLNRMKGLCEEYEDISRKEKAIKEQFPHIMPLDQ